jgi:hypothetical protein
MNIVKGTVEKIARNGGIMVNGDWYSSFKGKDTTVKGIAIGNAVTFEWTPDTKGLGYKNIKSLTITGGAPADALGSMTAATAAVPMRNNNLGVELGHASKLAMDMSIAYFSTLPGSAEIGSEDFYKFWIQNTDKVFKAMSALRKAKDKPEVTVTVAETPRKADPILASAEDEPF